MPSRKLRTPNSEEPLLLAERFRDASASLELRLWALADSLQPGEHPSVVPGRGVEVVGVREYQPGDEARGIDWRVTARRSRLYVKEFTREREIPLLLILHRGRTLWAGRGDAKARRAMEVMGLLAAVGLRGGDRVGLVLSGPGGKGFLPPRAGRDQLPRVLMEMQEPLRPAASGSLTEALNRGRHLLRERGRVFLIGDFQLGPSTLADLAPEIRRLAERHDVVPVRIQDREEGRIPVDPPLLLEDPETGTQEWCRNRDSVLRIRNAIRRRAGEVDALFRSLGLRSWTVDVDEPLVEGVARHLFPPSGGIVQRAGGGTAGGGGSP